MAKGDAKRERKRRQEEFEAMLAELCGLDAEGAQKAAQRLRWLFHNAQGMVLATVGELHHYKNEGVPDESERP